MRVACLAVGHACHLLCRFAPRIVRGRRGSPGDTLMTPDCRGGQPGMAHAVRGAPSAPRPGLVCDRALHGHRSLRTFVTERPRSASRAARPASSDLEPRQSMTIALFKANGPRAKLLRVRTDAPFSPRAAPKCHRPSPTDPAGRLGGGRARRSARHSGGDREDPARSARAGAARPSASGVRREQPRCDADGEACRSGAFPRKRGTQSGRENVASRRLPPRRRRYATATEREVRGRPS